MDFDLSAAWKILCMGGAYRDCQFGCHLCAEGKYFVGQFQSVQCDKWCNTHHSDDPDYKCHHQNMFTDENIADMRAEIFEYEQALVDIIPEIHLIDASPLFDLKFIQGNAKMNCQRTQQTLFFGLIV